MRNTIEITAMNFANPLHAKAAAELSQWTGKPGEVLLLDKERLESHPHKFIALDRTNDMLAGYIAITNEYLPQCIQLGGFVVNPNLVNQGIGKGLVIHLLDSVPQLAPEAEIITAFVNKHSRIMFQKLGAKAASDTTVYWYRGEQGFLPDLNK